MGLTIHSSTGFQEELAVKQLEAMEYLSCLQLENSKTSDGKLNIKIPITFVFDEGGCILPFATL